MGSVLLVSAAQLGMRWSMLQTATPGQWLTALQTGNVEVEALGVVTAAIAAYGLSMLCWLGALRDLPLSRAYSLLSISYALVYLLAAMLPVFSRNAHRSPNRGRDPDRARRSDDQSAACRDHRDNSGKEFPR
jgi:undecaprenyl phosphate-alpha-L-ara4N flippase subunit ArnF